MTGQLPAPLARAQITFDAHYFEVFYSDWLRFRSIRRRFGLISALAFSLGAACLFFAPRFHKLGILLVIVGFGYLIDVLTYKGRWIRRNLRAGGSSFGHFDFHPDRIAIKSDRSEGVYHLPGFVDIKEGKRGIFLYPTKQISFYIPWDSIEPADAVPKVREVLLRKGKLPSP